MQTEVLDEILYANDMAKNISTERKMHESMDLFSNAFDIYDFKTSTKANMDSVPASKWKALECVNRHTEWTKSASFGTIGRSTLSRAVHINDKVYVMIPKASVAFDRILGNT